MGSTATPTPRPLVVGTRGSPLALAQARETVRRLGAAAPAFAAAEMLPLQVIRTSGDRHTEGPLADVGGKGLFTKEIDEELLAGRIDVAVHSLKDVPTFLPPGLVIAAVLPREDPRDVLFAPAAKRIADLPRGARLGTVSLRRTAQVKALRPDIQVTPLRGNVETRLQKVKAGAFDAVLLARAGLKRLGLLEAGGVPIDPDEILPAVGQGAIAVICRESDADIRAWLALAEDETSARCVTAERAMLAVLDGSCRTPIGGLAEIAGETLALRGLVAKPDGSVVLRAHASGPAADAVAIGEEVGRELRRRAGPGFVAGWR